MTKQKVLEQLRALIDNAQDNLKTTCGDGQVWSDDIECCKICIDLVEKYYQPQRQLDIPSIDDITRDYNNVLALFDNVRDPEKLRDLGRAYQVTVEINGMEDRCGNWDGLTEYDVEYVRIESYNNLQYIYFYYAGKKTIMFDVWADEVDAEFITDITIDKLEEAYEKGIKWIKERAQKNDTI